MTNIGPVHLVILAAGQGTRMKSGIPKVLHRVAGRSMIERVLQVAGTLRPASTTIVVGYQADVVKNTLGGRQDLQFVLQEPQLGTGHAFLQTEPLLLVQSGTVVLLAGDVPLLTAATLRRLLDVHAAATAAATVVTAVVERPYGYGRIIRTGGRITRIVEERDAS